MEYSTDANFKAIHEAPASAQTMEGLRLLGVRVADEVIAGRQAVESVKSELYDRLKSLVTHDAPKPEKPPFKGASSAHLNVMQVKGDALATNVLGTMFAKKPYCVAMAGWDKDRFRRNLVAERVVQFFVDKGMATFAVQESSQDAFLYNVGPVFTEFVPTGDGFDPTPTVKYRSIEAFDHFVYPPSVVSRLWEDPVKSCGHRIWKRRSSCDALKKKGVYADIPVSSDLPEGVRQAAEQSVTKHIPHDSAGQKANDLLPLWYVCFKDVDSSGDEVWWWGLISEHDKQFLQLRRHKEPRPPYHVLRYKPNKGEYWSKCTVGNDLQGVQIEINNLLRMWLDGTKWNIYGTSVGQSFGRSDQMLQMEPGGVTLLDNPKDAQYWNPGAELAYIPEALQFLLAYADQIVRISQEFTGGESESSTATQAAIRQAGMRAGVDDYIATASLSIVSLYEYTHLLAVSNVEAWWDELSVFLGLTDEDRALLEEPVMWQPHTAGIGATPGTQVQILQMVMESLLTLKAPIDVRLLAEQILVQAERMGLAGSQEMMLPEGPEDSLRELSQILGIEPLILEDAVKQAAMVQQAAMEGQKNDERAKIGEAVASGMGVPPEGGDDQGAGGVPQGALRASQTRAGVA